MDVVVIGAGQAGAAVAAKLRALGHDGSITLIGEETAPPYQRPPLSKAYLLGQMEAERLLAEEAAKLRREDYQLAYAIDILKGMAALKPKE